MLTAIYKCQYCGQVFDGLNFPHANTGTDVSTAAAVRKIIESMEAGPLNRGSFTKTILHCCADHIGIADFVGFRKKQ